MGLFNRQLFTSLPEALANPTACYRLHLQVADNHLREWGPRLLELTNIQELRLHGLPALYDHQDYSLPEELGRLRTLREVELLNLPLAFPAWVRSLLGLRILTLRGTDVAALPEWIAELQKLRTLRIENCALHVLPDALRHLTHLRELSLSDTRLTDLRAAQFPLGLRSLNLGGSHGYQRTDLERLRQALGQTRINPSTE
jgi:hypothetical protein